MRPVPACGVCDVDASGKYTCPRCKLRYCSVHCFQHHKPACEPQPAAPKRASTSLFSLRRTALHVHCNCLALHPATPSPRLCVPPERPKRSAFPLPLTPPPVFGPSSAASPAAEGVRGRRGRGGGGRPACEAGRLAARRCVCFVQALWLGLSPQRHSSRTSLTHAHTPARPVQCATRASPLHCVTPTCAQLCVRLIGLQTVKRCGVA